MCCKMRFVWYVVRRVPLLGWTLFWRGVVGSFASTWYTCGDFYGLQVAFYIKQRYPMTKKSIFCFGSVSDGRTRGLRSKRPSMYFCETESPQFNRQVQNSSQFLGHFPIIPLNRKWSHLCYKSFTLHVTKTLL